MEAVEVDGPSMNNSQNEKTNKSSFQSAQHFARVSTRKYILSTTRAHELVFNEEGY